MQTLRFLRDDASAFLLAVSPDEAKVSAKKERIVGLPAELFALRSVKTLWVRGDRVDNT